MRKIVMFNLISLDGFFAGPKGEIDWHVTDDEFNKFGVEQTRTFGTILFGRITYQLFEDFWPKAAKDPKMSNEDLIIAKIINNIDKIVFSKTLKEISETPNWKNVRLFREVSPKDVQKLKGKAGKDIVIFGSGTIVQRMTDLRLIDEYRVLVNPVVLGRGKLLFRDVKRLNLKLVKIRKFKSGNVLLQYQR
jgi:dihydrofolate reductase